MPLPTAQPGGSGLSRSEAAIEAWKKRTRAAKPGALDPKIAARVKEILAGKAKKGKAKGKGKKGPDPAKAKAKAERAKAAADKKAEREKAKAERTAAQATAKEERAKSKAEREKAKIERAVLQQQKQAAKQKQLKRAAQAKKKAGSGKAKAAQAKQQQAQQHKARVLAEKVRRGEKLSASDQVDAEDAGLVKRAGKALDMDDNDTSLLAIKAGARHSKMDASHLDEASRHLHAAGAMCPDCAPDEEGDDDEAAAKAIKGIMDNPAWYASHECGDVAQACAALQTITMLIQSELSEEDEDAGDVTRLMDAADTLVDFIGSQLSELRGAAKDGARAQGYKAADWLHTDGGAVKAADDGAIEGLGVLYATKTTHDLEKDFYNKDTDLWLDHWGWPRPITYHHGMDAGTRDDPVIGHWTKATVTDEGVWLSGQLDRAHRYYKAIKELAQRGYLKISSDSGPQWVIREPQSNGANYIKRWPLVSASLTVTPMEPRMFPVEVKAFLDELGYVAPLSHDAIDDSPEAINPESARRDGVKADDERARRLSIQQRMIHLRETMNGPTS